MFTVIVRRQYNGRGRRPRYHRMPIDGHGDVIVKTLFYIVVMNIILYIGGSMAYVTMRCI